ncbi:MAG: D-2-hydroxyacid dehydrogenase [Bellilinea sp.]
MDTTPIEVLITVAFSEELVAPLRQLSPRLRITLQPARSAEDIPADLWNRVEVLYTDRILPTPAAAPKLRWVQFHYAGIDHVAGNPLLDNRDLAITTLSGAAAPQVAEYAVMMMLALGHKMPELHSNQYKADWPKDRWERFKPVELRGSTVGIIGYGSIGREIARLLQPFDVKVLAAKRDLMHPEDIGYMPPGLGDPGGDLFTRLYPITALKSMVKKCDFVVVCVPLTDSTRNLVGEAELAAMSPRGYLVDVSRGGIIQTQALVEALREKKIAGAALDVFAEEPLPSSSPLWKLPNVLISPHISGISPHYAKRAVDLFSENLERYLIGEELFNLYESEWGY